MARKSELLLCIIARLRSQHETIGHITKSYCLLRLTKGYATALKFGTGLILVRSYKELSNVPHKVIFEQLSNSKKPI